jgi:iron complex transport system ATP-binding protein
MKKHPENTILLKELEVGYRVPGKTSKRILGPVNAVISHSEMAGIIGRNGIGKSTLLRTIAGLQHPIAGEILINGREIREMTLREMARTISFVSTEQIYAFQIRVEEVVAMGRIPHTGWFGRHADEDRTAIGKAIELTGINDFRHKPVHELSDGERQKVMIARALAQDTPFIILDEPTAFLDVPARYEIFRILNDLTLRNHKTILFSTHDLSMAIDVADKIWLLAENEVFQGAPEDLLISKVFRKLFLNSPAEFDSKTSTFRFRRELNKQIGLQGESRYRSLTKKAMERIGFQSADEINDLTVNLAEKEGKPVWYLHQDQNIFTFYSIYDLIVHLKLTIN